MPDEVFRLKTVFGDDTNSGGMSTLYGDRDEFELALMNAVLEVAARPLPPSQHTGKSDKPRRRVLKWLTHKRPEAPDQYGMLRSRGIRRVIAAEQYVDGEWRSMDWELDPPQIRVSRPGEPLSLPQRTNATPVTVTAGDLAAVIRFAIESEQVRIDWDRWYPLAAIVNIRDAIQQAVPGDA